ncbi:ACT domain-containing protein [Hahella ganghwensis]|uniref:ACT domain-containing protein n=1 Tax=Hahella ganghwensis TaxID=286420 RepID=UPI00036D6FBC|nr:ACT domain-containing protein [Hahella ganghwensis]
MNSQSNSYNLQCQFSTQTGAIERLLRMIRVRGFTVQDLRLEMMDGYYQATFTVTGQRCIANLLSQLDKLIEVVTVSQMPEQALEKCA